jgi:hypothetical protein
MYSESVDGKQYKSDDHELIEGAIEKLSANYCGSDLIVLIATD